MSYLTFHVMSFRISRICFLFSGRLTFSHVRLLCKFLKLFRNHYFYIFHTILALYKILLYKYTQVHRRSKEENQSLLFYLMPIATLVLFLVMPYHIIFSLTCLSYFGRLILLSMILDYLVVISFVLVQFYLFFEFQRSLLHLHGDEQDA